MTNKKIRSKAKVIQQTPLSNLVSRLFRYRYFPRLYVFTSFFILLASTLFWSILSARIHSNNADQLVNPYLFESGHTFHGALIPGQHTFLLKWPLFLLVKLMGSTTYSYIVITAALTLTTISCLVYIIHRIERRPFIKGTLFLALASVLFAIPAQPYPGGLLPMNMAMIATRNIEYIVYIWCIWGLIKTKTLRSRTWILSCAGLGLLIASDKLFLTLTAGAAIIACTTYVLRQRWYLASFTARWIITTAVGALSAFAVILIVEALNITHIAGAGNGPYGIIKNINQLLHAILFGILGLLGNFGANPAFDSVSVKEIPSQVLKHVFSFGGPILIANSLILLLGLAASGSLLFRSLGRRLTKKRDLAMADSQILAIVLIWTSLTALAAFLFTDHYYMVDARYISISLFAVFISMATYARTKLWDTDRLVKVGLALTLCLLMSVPMVLSSYRNSTKASQSIDDRNRRVAQAILSHPVSTLVGDYWRVIPIKHQMNSKIPVTPLNDCVTPREVLSSTAWQPDLQKTSFAYLFSLDKSMTDFPACNIDVIFSSFGRPNASVVIAGNLEHPKELLLFYDHGSHTSAPNNSPSSSDPTLLNELTNTICSVPTILNIVAHQDDDLLFMNPDIQHDISAGHCIRTVYVTAGDAGSNEFYWLGREQGSEAAYSKMVGDNALWVHRVVKLDDNQYVTISNPKGNSKVSLIFMHLPDGNLLGQGFFSSRHESLQRLMSGQIANVRTVYGNSAYSSDGLTAALTRIMHLYQPAVIRTQATYASIAYPDHSDHMAVSRFTEKAYRLYEANQFNNNVTIPITHYIGYPIHGMPENVSPEDLEAKTAAFLSYSKHDGSVCHSTEDCAASSTYGSYLRRQYTQ